MQRKRKYSVVSTSVPHAHVALIVSLKLCLNLFLLNLCPQNLS